jgi:hypothetical protein
MFSSTTEGLLMDERRLALLIDADNASARHLEDILVEIARHGRASIRRAYGDWTSTRMSSWKSPLLQHSIQPVQQFSYTTGKNATDSALIIDAMDLLHAGNLDGYCLVSSDSDFTRLAARIREQGLVVYGFGERKTPQPFVTACDQFIYVENLGAPESVPTPTASTLADDANLDRMLREAVTASTGDDGWAHLSTVGSKLARLASDFDPRTWGFQKLKDLFESHPDYEVESRKGRAEHAPIAWVRARAQASTVQPASTLPIS